MLKNNITLLGLLLIIAVSFYAGGKCQSPEIITTTEIVTEIDSSRVDSLLSIIEYYESIPEEEEEQKVIDKPDNITDVTKDSVRNITTSYSDQFIVSSNFMTMNILTGEILDTKFTYILRRRLVREKTLSITQQINKITTTNTTRTVKEGMYFQAGAISNFNNIVPVIGITTKGKLSILYGYDFTNKAHTVGILTKF